MDDEQNKYSSDISRILNEWQFDPEYDFRIIEGDDGRRKIQIRAYDNGAEGIFQIEVEGRPDGKKPHNCDFAYEFYYKQACDDIEPEDYDNVDFSLTKEAYAELMDESYMITGRYDLFEKLGMHEELINDTDRQINLLDLVIGYAPDKDDRSYAVRSILPPICLNASTRVSLDIENGDYESAVNYVEETLEVVDNMHDENNYHEFYIEKLEAIIMLAARGVLAAREGNDCKSAIRIANKALEKMNNLPELAAPEFYVSLRKEIGVLERIIFGLDKDIHQHLQETKTGYVFDDPSYQANLPETTSEPLSLSDAEQEHLEIVGVSQEEIDYLMGKDPVEREPEPELTEKEKLERQMQIAVTFEDYETATILRDKIKVLEE
jgi:hypothetical protein